MIRRPRWLRSRVFVALSLLIAVLAYLGMPIDPARAGNKKPDAVDATATSARCERYRDGGISRHARAVPVANADEITVATQNLYRLFDDQRDGKAGEPVLSHAQYVGRLAKWSLYIRHILHAPDVLAVQEAENLKVLQDLAARLQQDDPALHYRVWLLEGHDQGGIDVGLMVREERREKTSGKAGNTLLPTDVVQLAADVRFAHEGSPLFDRPPLLARFPNLAGRPVQVVVVHLRSMLGLDKPGKRQRVLAKRRAQAEWLAAWQHQQKEDVIMLGDFNAEAGDDSADDSLSLLLQPATTLQDILSHLPAAERYSYVHACKGSALDHVLLSPRLLTQLSRVAVSRGNADSTARFGKQYDVPERASDHDGLVVYLRAGSGVQEHLK